ncbi:MULTISPECIES: FAD-binding oxidoreductase [unclassified Microbacterium]|uniref:FAD-binding oxidoreductase n=1 Tax=unclassified Microbacterium TaxID=2609290 RepID=UPI003866B063
MTSVLARLVAALGERVDTSAPSLAEARADKSGHRAAGTPIAVVRARSVADVQETMRIAHDTGTPVVVRGAGTGLAGGAGTGDGEISLSLRAMDRLLEVRSDDLLAVVEPGILNADLNSRLADHGLWWAPDPASRDISTVGGNIATGAGGLLCAKYGVVRDAVLGLDVVLADGRLISVGHRSVKGVTGYDLTALMIGSEGTLGVVVGATLKLRRLIPGETRTLTATFSSIRDAAAGAAAVTAAGWQPSIMELMDATSLRAVHALLGLPDPGPAAAQLTVQTDGTGAALEQQAIADVLAGAGGYVRLAADDAEAAQLWRVRRAMHPAMESLGTALIEDVSVPRSALPAMFDEIERIERTYGLTIPVVCHAGDGNLHPNFIFDGDEVPAVIWQAADDLFRSAIRLGGTLTGEHGVGVLKRRWLADELGADQWDLQRGIKAVFDPTGILNPGKVFDPQP